MDSRRFKPYEARCASPTMYGSIEAGPSRLPPLLPYDAQPITQPTGGRPETTADAEQDQPLTEEEEAPVSDFYCSPVPRVNHCSFDVRKPRPGAPVAKGYRAPTASGTKKIYSSCEHG